MELTQKTCKEFAEILASKQAVPGGGGAAALTGALGVALASMVANFSIGKKKFIGVEEKHKEILERGEELRERLLSLIDEDAENFFPLSEAYGIKAETDEEKEAKQKKLQSALKVACSAPVKMVEAIYESILVHQELVDISSKIIISDVGVGVQCLKAALYGAQLNVMINVNSINDEEYAAETRKHIDAIVEVGAKVADEVYEKVLKTMNR
ncbi:MAG: cyclodeaminase/cyclohydrolase family protein [Peptostreptococcaceae bacterium]|nr:cyclodeaminase/cyclohydrolase family protein [Peptostreptococcaceae bacterium]